MASDRGTPESLEASERLVRWTRLQGQQEFHPPSPRAGHAMTLLAPSQSVLLFGGSDSREHLADFYVLESAQYAALASVQSTRQVKLRAKMKMRNATSDQGADGGGDRHARGPVIASRASAAEAIDTHTAQLFAWMKLVVSRAKTLRASGGPDVSPESPRDNVARPIHKSKTKARTTIAIDPHLDSGRDYHTMHYIPTQDEMSLGYRVLVVGNVVVGDEDGSAQEYDSIDLRVDELRVKQPELIAQWTARTIQSSWTPKARIGHCSALLGGQLFCFGGKNVAETVYYNDMFYLDVCSNQWREPTSTGRAPSPRAFAAMTATHEQLFVYGGHGDVEVFGGLFMFDVRHNRWDYLQTLGEKPETRSAHSLTQVTTNHLLLFGGRNTTRRNDVFLYNITTKRWKQLAEQTSATKQSSKPQRTSSDSHSLGQVAATRTTVPAVSPPQRANHSAVLLGPPEDAQLAKEKCRIIVFGGYAGSHTWLNDLFVMEVDPKALTPRLEGQQANMETPSTSSRESSVTRGTFSVSQSSNSTTRSSQGSIAGALVENMNIPHSEAQPAIAWTELPVVSSGIYIPAAVAARRRQLVEMERKEESSPPTATAPRTTKHKKQRSHSSVSSSRQPQDHSPPPPPEVPISASDATGLHTAMVQLLRNQQRMDMSLASLASFVREGQSLAAVHQDAFTAQQVFMQTQLETLETKLDIMTKQYMAMTSRVVVLERDKHTLQTQLTATKTEVDVNKKIMEEIILKLRNYLFDTIKMATRTQNTATQLIESRISVIHDLLEDMRHYSGERTESDDSPPKNNSSEGDTNEAFSW